MTKEEIIKYIRNLSKTTNKRDAIEIHKDEAKIIINELDKYKEILDKIKELLKKYNKSSYYEEAILELEMLLEEIDD